MRPDYPTWDQIPGLRRLWTVVFGDGNEFLDQFFSTAYSHTRCRGIWDGWEPAASLYWFDCTCQGAKFAYIYAVGTAPSHRNQGLCRVLMADTLDVLRERGYDGAILVPAGEALFAMYRKMGFRDCCTQRQWEVSASVPCPVSELSPQEYENLRKTYLPEGGMVQAGENLDFLCTMARFYRTPEGVLAAYREGDALHGLELLGDSRKAPEIAAALGCTRGTFRGPGADGPAAMYVPLTEACPRPSYFGFPFD